MSSRSLIVAVCSVVVKVSERRVLDMKLTDLGLLLVGAGDVSWGVEGGWEAGGALLRLVPFGAMMGFVYDAQVFDI